MVLAAEDTTMNTVPRILFSKRDNKLAHDVFCMFHIPIDAQ